MKSDSKKTVSQAILWAAAMIGTALLMKDSEQKESAFLLLLVLATTSMLAMGKAGDDLRCLKRKLSGNKEGE